MLKALSEAHEEKLMAEFKKKAEEEDLARKEARGEGCSSRHGWEGGALTKGSRGFRGVPLSNFILVFEENLMA